MRPTAKQMKQRASRRRRLEKTETPYWPKCLDCQLSCENGIISGGKGYDILTCPKPANIEPMFPYKFKEMKEKAEQEDRENGKTKSRK